jgi:hypothetical protein
VEETDHEKLGGCIRGGLVPAAGGGERNFLQFVTFAMPGEGEDQVASAIMESCGLPSWSNNVDDGASYYGGGHRGGATDGGR